MIILEDNSPREMSVIKSTKKKNDVLQNHEGDISTCGAEASGISQEIKRNELHKRKAKPATKKYDMEKTTANKSENTEDTLTEISKDDLEELKNVYNQCKSVMNRIESKYGHLLGLDLKLEGRQMRKHKFEQSEDVDCNCSTNKKIIFDEDGQQLLKETTLDKHVCPNKLMKSNDTVVSKARNMTVDKSKIQIEIGESVTLPDDLQSLVKILQDTSIELTYRNMVIDKVRTIKQEHLNNIRFDRPNLIEKVKSDATKVLDFKGTNLASLPGYPTWK